VIPNQTNLNQTKRNHKNSNNYKTNAMPSYTQPRDAFEGGKPKRKEKNFKKKKKTPNPYVLPDQKSKGLLVPACLPFFFVLSFHLQQGLLCLHPACWISHLAISTSTKTETSTF
jgi:hypothetical protein